MSTPKLTFPHPLSADKLCVSNFTRARIAAMTPSASLLLPVPAKRVFVALKILKYGFLTRLLEKVCLFTVFRGVSQ
jgi:hypothetical protein